MILRPLPAPLIFCTGLALGIAGFWIVRATSPFASPPPPADHPPFRLAAPEATSAIDGWLHSEPPSSEELPYLIRLKLEDQQAAALRALLTRLPDDALPRLVETLLTRDGIRRPRFYTLVLETWLDRDSPAAAQWIATSPPSLEPALRLRLARQIGTAWAQSDFNAAYGWTLALPDRALADSVAELILPSLAETDAPRALALVETKNPDFVARLREPIFSRWAKTDSLAALRTLGRDILDGAPRSPVVLAALGDWMLQDLSASLDWLKREGPALPVLRQTTLPATLRDLVSRQTDSHAIETLANQISQNDHWPERTIALTSLASAWMAKDPDAARLWLSQLPDPADRHALIALTLPEVWLEAPIPGSARSSEYLPLALTLPPSPARTARLTRLLSSWAKQDPAAATTWVNQQATTDSSLAPLAVDLAHNEVATLAASDPAAAINRFAELPPAANRTSIATALALAWARNDPGAAARWLASTLPEISRPHATAPSTDPHPDLTRAALTFADLLTTWLDLAPLPTLRWTESLPDTAQRDFALTTIALGPPASPSPAPRPDPAERAQLLAQLSDPTLRTTYLSLHFSDWLKRDYYGASEWMRAHKTLPPALSERLLSAPPPSAPSP